MQEKQAYILERMRANRLCYSNVIRGASPSEITNAEQKFGLEFPLFYRWFLENIPEEHGSLSLEISVSLAESIDANEQYRKDYAEFSHEDEMVELPANAWILANRYGEQYQFIECSQGTDPPVLYFNDWSTKIKTVSPNVFSWLTEMMDGCEALFD